MTLNEPDDGDKDGVCQVIVGLMQKDRRKARAKGEDNFAVGYMMYKVTGQCREGHLRKKTQTFVGKIDPGLLET